MPFLATIATGFLISGVVFAGGMGVLIHLNRESGK